MFGLRRDTIEWLKKEYPKGTKVELIHLDDPYRNIPAGFFGFVVFVVVFVDVAGLFLSLWVIEGFLALIYGVDEWKKL